MFVYTPPPDNGLDIVYLDEHLIAINKPSGLLSVPGKGEDRQDSIISRVQKEYKNALIIHRLDMATSGLIIMALDKETHREMSILFQDRKIEKQYTAITENEFEITRGEIDLPLITDWPNRPKQMIDHEKGKPSKTKYQVLSHDKKENTSRVKLKPVTGRSHQLRVHLMAIGHAILGDRLYANHKTRDKSDRLLLHSTSLEFIHPKTQEHLIVKCLPDF